MNDVVELRPGRVYGVGAGPVDVAVTQVGNPAPDGRPVQVALMVVAPDGAEQDFDLEVDDRFEIGPDVWRVASIDGAGSGDFVVRIARVDESERGRPVIASRQRQQELRRQYQPSAQSWQRAREQVQRAEEERRRRLFGDQEPFAIPDEEYDP